MLRRPAMPSVIIETHHAWHPDEWARWQEENTRLAFAFAVGVIRTRALAANRGVLEMLLRGRLQ